MIDILEIKQLAASNQINIRYSKELEWQAGGRPPVLRLLGLHTAAVFGEVVVVVVALLLLLLLVLLLVVLLVLLVLLLVLVLAQLVVVVVVVVLLLLLEFR